LSSASTRPPVTSNAMSNASTRNMLRDYSLGQGPPVALRARLHFFWGYGRGPPGLRRPSWSAECHAGRQPPFRAPQREHRIRREMVSSGVSMSSP
jgi:hypothetical protein